MEMTKIQTAEERDHAAYCLGYGAYFNGCRDGHSRLMRLDAARAKNPFDKYCQEWTAFNNGAVLAFHDDSGGV
jgi:hypothetical protein